MRPYNSTLSRFPKNERDMEIKDVVKYKVLPFLPAKSLIRFREVSKDWDCRIRSPFLAHEQSYCFTDISGFFCQCSNTNPTFMTLNQAAYGVPTPSLRFLPEFVNIRTSSSGLLVCQSSMETHYYICNPATEEWKELPQPESYHGSKAALVLAFEPSILDFKAHYQLICAVSFSEIVCFEVYSSETMSWRCSPCCPEWDGSSIADNGLYMKGMAYWETSSRNILAFDPNTDFCGIIPLPSETPLGGVLSQIHEELSYITVSNNSGHGFSINVYGGVDMSLKTRMDVHLDVVGEAIEECRVLTCVKGSAVMILVGGVIYSYSLSDQRTEVVSVVTGVDLAASRFLPYVNSLVSVA